MFGVDVFNYGSIFNADEDGNTPSYFCIECNDNFFNGKVWVNGERRKEVEDIIDNAGIEGDSLPKMIDIEENLFL